MEGRKKMFCLTTHSIHFISGYMELMEMENTVPKTPCPIGYHYISRIVDTMVLLYQFNHWVDSLSSVSSSRVRSLNMTDLKFYSRSVFNLSVKKVYNTQHS